MINRSRETGGSLIELQVGDNRSRVWIGCTRRSSRQICDSRLNGEAISCDYRALEVGGGVQRSVVYRIAWDTLEFNSPTLNYNSRDVSQSIFLIRHLNIFKGGNRSDPKFHEVTPFPEIFSQVGQFYEPEKCFRSLLPE